MFIFLLILILLAVLGVLGLALKIAAALLLGIFIAAATLTVIGYVVARRYMRKAQRTMRAPSAATRPVMGGTTVEVGEPQRAEDDPQIDDRY
jgi:membrane protein implicated in regulation of membrane protease activity